MRDLKFLNSNAIIPIKISGTTGAASTLTLNLKSTEYIIVDIVSSYVNVHYTTADGKFQIFFGKYQELGNGLGLYALGGQSNTKVSATVYVMKI